MNGLDFSVDVVFFATTFCWAANVIGIPSWSENILFFGFRFFLACAMAYSEHSTSSADRTPFKMAWVIISLAAAEGFGGWNKI